MKTCQLSKLVQLFVTTLGAASLLVLLMGLMSSTHVQGAPPEEHREADLATIEVITLTASLPISDTRPGDRVSRTVYFNNRSSGVLSITFQITGTAPFTLTAGAAFYDPVRAFTSSVRPWTQSLTYSIGPNDPSYAGVPYTVANGTGTRSTTLISYTRDITSPIVTVDVPSSWQGLSPIPVTWQALDASSGVARTRLYYRQDPSETEWEDAELEQTGESGTFYFTPSDYATYSFAAQTTDHVSNVNALPVTGTQVSVNPVRIYLPMSVRHWASWFRHDMYEPNDTPETAWGPLLGGEDYEACIWNSTDKEDYYYFTPSTTSQVGIALTSIPEGCDFDLYVYYYDGEYRQVAYSNQTGNADENVDFTPVAGRQYYVRVFPYSGFSQEPYVLTATYE
jgi:hypothetical protein